MLFFECFARGVLQNSRKSGLNREEGPQGATKREKKEKKRGKRENMRGNVEKKREKEREKERK